MKYISTRGQIEPVEFCRAVMMGLADDGGLVIPRSIPDVRGGLNEWRRLGYSALAFEVFRQFVSDIPQADLQKLVNETYAEAFPPAVVPVVPAGDVFVAELWHGPTLAFKDIALQFLGRLFEYILSLTGERLNILGATSGDTGSAAIAGVRGRQGVNIFVMHPRGAVSRVQELQMTTVMDANVHNLAVDGTFDDCQRIMKTLFSDLDFKRRVSLGAINSVNWARVMAQIVYYFKAAFDVQAATGAKSIRVAVPTGNFGDVLAGWYAMKMGAPIRRLILATNRNDILSRFFNTGEYSLGKVVRTMSPSMDIQVASNFERYLYYKLGCDSARLRDTMRQFAETGSLRVAPSANGAVDADFVAGAASEEDCLAAIGEYYRRYDYLLDPHTAVGVSVAGKLPEPKCPTVCLATAHPAKFPEAIAKAVGRDVARHPVVEALANLPTRCELLPNDVEAVRHFILANV